MPLVKYRIYELSARAVISYGRQQECAYAFQLSAAETEKCKSLSAPHEQDDNALFYQIMCVLHGGTFTGTPGGQLVTDLSDIIFYMDFSGIFDRSGSRKKHLIRQEKAKALFRPEGVSLDFGPGPHRYLAFERSGSMSRQARLSFIREDFYDTVRRRIMMDMTIGDCQLSKLYAYNGLMLSSGIRIDGIGIDQPHRVVVVDNPVRTPPPTEVITVEDDGTQNSTRKYHRVETMADVEVTCFDGEGLISKQYARLIDEKLCGKKVHTSFQIRMPYVKGMLHEVDFKDYLDRSGADTITDLWGVQHPIQKVDIILTKSMFKGCGWLTGSGMSWEDYWVVFRKYRHALYITNVSKEKPEKTTELNYQFLNTVSLKADEFRPADLPDGWDHSPETDERNWLTKQTELAYYSFCADESFRQNYFLEKFERVSWWERQQGKDQILAAVLKKNPRFINEPIYAKRLEAEADKIAEQYAVGRLIVAGDNRYLSGDLLDFLNCLPVTKTGTSKKTNTFINFRWGLELNHQNFFAPGAAYQSGHVCTLLRNPHIARNEEMQLYPLEDSKNLRDQYLGHLTDVVMVGYTSLAAERLGGADYDGDMIKTISDPILNECVKRNIYHDPPRPRSVFSRSHNLPLLMIPTAQPQIRNADDWEARFETVRSTFSSRVGQICNAALDRSIIAYNENSDVEERERCREETETLAILTGLEIDSAKSGIRPDLDEYLIQDLLLQDAKIDLFGVGERMITAKSEPVFGGVYKLAAVEDQQGNITPKIKISENVEKITIPHFKKVYRFYGNDTGKAIADYITVYDETLDDTKDLEIFDPSATWKKKTVYNFTARPLLVPVFLGGKRVYDSPSLPEIQAYCRQQVDTLWDEVKRFDNPHSYYVDLSDRLWNIQQDLLRNRK